MKCLPLPRRRQSNLHETNLCPSSVTTHASSAGYTQRGQGSIPVTTIQWSCGTSDVNCVSPGLHDYKQSRGLCFIYNCRLMISYDKKKQLCNIIKNSSANNLSRIIHLYSTVHTRTHSHTNTHLLFHFTSFDLYFYEAALNYQTAGIPMQLNQGRFQEDNGGCGYILKPRFMLQGVLNLYPS